MRAHSFVFALLAVLAVAGDVQAQRVELQPFVGARFGGGFSVDNPDLGPDTLDINIASGFTWGGTVGFDVTDRVQVEFMYSRQESTLSFKDGPDLFDASLAQYHGNVLIHFMARDARVRPYILFGLGATNLDPDQEGLEGATKFSFGVGGGLKLFIRNNVGARVQLRLTPTYVSDETALFCDAFGFCYLVEVADYLYQGEFTAGVTFRF